MSLTCDPSTGRHVYDGWDDEPRCHCGQSRNRARSRWQRLLDRLLRR